MSRRPLLLLLLLLPLSLAACASREPRCTELQPINVPALPATPR